MADILPGQMLPQDGTPTLPGVTPDPTPDSAQLLADLTAKDAQIAALSVSHETDNTELLAFREAETKRQTDKDQRAKDKRDKDIVAGDHKSLAENYKRDHDALLAKNAELIQAVANNESVTTQLNQYKTALEASVKTELAEFSAEQINVIKQSGVWDESDPAGQLNAINYYKSIVGTRKATMPGNIGVPSHTSKDNEQYSNLLKTGRVEEALLMNLNKMN